MARHVVVCLALICLSTPAAGREAISSPESDAPLVVHTDGGSILTSTTTGAALLQRESAGPDTFDLYGGPRGLVRDPDGVPGSGDEYVEGRFEDPTGRIARGLSASEGDWTGVDLTEQDVFWQVDTFNAENLNGNGPGNRAMWCGLRADDPRTEFWTDAPGYGNNWSERLVFFQEVSDPSVGQTVDLDFVFNVDSEPDYDFFRVSYVVNGIEAEVYSFSGTTSTAAPGTRFSDVATAPITYAGGDYAFGDQIRVVIEFRSDGAWSDEDGLFASNGGAQVDDVTITTSEGTFTEDFEGPGPYVFEPEKPPFFGDFANVFAFTSDLDPCVENRSPQVNFVDFGQELPNGPGVTGLTSTGGSTSPTWDYGSPGGFVLNYGRGISGANLYLTNQVWSPEIAWDLPGTDDDDPAVTGSILSFDVWSHFPSNLPFYYQWGVRFFANGQWTSWRDYGFVYGFGTERSFRLDNEITRFVEPGTEKLQIALGVIDLSSVILFVDEDATPAPWFDNVRLRKYRIGGPSLSIRESGLANDAFAVSGLFDTTTPAARDVLDVRFDAAQSIAGDDATVPGDSVVIDAQAVIPGTTIDDVRMVWTLRQNPLFEAALRQVPARAVDENFSSTVDAFGRTVWSGEVAMTNAVSAGGTVVPNRWDVDLPDEDFLYPGDLLHYHFVATDDGGRVSTLPVDLSGFGAWDENGRSSYSRTFTVRALPTFDDAGAPPDVLLVNDGGRRGQEEELVGAFEQSGYLEGRDFDTYTVQDAARGVGNGIGAAGRFSAAVGERRGHGASIAQLLGYRTVVYTADRWANNLLAAGQTDIGLDPSPDLQLLSAWKNAPGRRATIHFGDNVVSGLIDGPAAGADYVRDLMGVDLVQADLSGLLGAPTQPRAQSLLPELPVDFAAFGLCPSRRSYDQIVPRTGAVATHVFLDAVGVPVAGAAAGVVFDRDVGGDRKVDLTFPFGIASITDDLARTSGPTARARLLGAALDFVGAQAAVLTPTAAPTTRTPTLDVAPTPFNPNTVVTFTLPRVGVVASVRVYDVRGQRVRSLHDGVASAAELRLDWDGRDDQGATVGSGVYFVRATTGDFDATRKVMLVK